MIYCNTAQLRHLLLALRYVHGTQVTSTLDPIGSCVHSVVPSLLNGECQVTVPDPGDFERAGAQEDEMVLTVPTARLEELMDGVYHFEESGMGFRRFSLSHPPRLPAAPLLRGVLQEVGPGRSQGRPSPDGMRPARPPDRSLGRAGLLRHRRTGRSSTSVWLLVRVHPGGVARTTGRSRLPSGTRCARTSG